MPSSTKDNPDYTLAYRMIAESTYWFRKGTLVLAARHADKISLSGSTLRISFGANALNLSEFIRSVRACTRHLLSIDGDGTLPKNVVQSTFYSWVESSVENHLGEAYSSYPIKEECFVFGATYVYLPNMIQLVTEDELNNLYHLDRYWY